MPTLLPTSIDGSLKLLQCVLAHADGGLDGGLGQRVTIFCEQTIAIRQGARRILRRMPDGKDCTIALPDTVRVDISKIVAAFRELASRLRATTAAVWKLAYGSSVARSVSAEVILQLGMVLCSSLIACWLLCPAPLLGSVSVALAVYSVISPK